jgi:pimeloyl-ACP methyl ester carboxylesterase
MAFSSPVEASSPPKNVHLRFGSRSTAATKSSSATTALYSEWGIVTFLEKIHAFGVRTCSFHPAAYFPDVIAYMYISDVVLADWTIRELAMYDLPALVDWVCLATGYDKIAFIGHSQGNGIGFLSLSMGHRPELGDKLSCFIALAPAVFAGPLTRGFPFTVLNKVKWKTWQRLFGVQDYIPLMRYSYDYVPALIFSTMGYTMFAFLFEWTDTNW